MKQTLHILSLLGLISLLNFYPIKAQEVPWGRIEAVTAWQGNEHYKPRPIFGVNFYVQGDKHGIFNFKGKLAGGPNYLHMSSAVIGVPLLALAEYLDANTWYSVFLIPMAMESFSFDFRIKDKVVLSPSASLFSFTFIDNWNTMRFSGHAGLVSSFRLGKRTLLGISAEGMYMYPMFGQKGSLGGNVGLTFSFEFYKKREAKDVD